MSANTINVTPYRKESNGTMSEFRFASTGKLVDLADFVPYSNAEIANYDVDDIANVASTDDVDSAIKKLDGKVRILSRDKVNDVDLASVAKSGSYADLSNKPTIPTKVSDLTNDSGFLTDVSWDDIDDKPSSFTPSAHNHTSANVTALTGYAKAAAAGEIAASDSLNVALGKIQKTLDAKQNSGDVIAEATKATKDGSGNVITSTYATKEELSAIPKFGITVVDSLPATGDNATVYLVRTGDESGNLYTEYVYVNNKWEELGTQEVDLSNYATLDDLPTKLSDLTNDSGFITANGTVAHATTATSATKDSANNTINTTYIKGVTYSGHTVTVTKGDNTSTTFNTADTTYDAADGSHLGLVQIGANISSSNGIISLTQSNVTSALGYTPPRQDTTYDVFDGATETEAGTAGLVPAPGAGTQNKYLKADGSWDTPPIVTYDTMTAAEITAGTSTTARVVSAKVISDFVSDEIDDIDTGVMSVTTGSANGTISVDGSNVSVKGLGSAAYTASTAYAAASHNQASNTINAMTGYSKPSSTSAIGTSDTLNAAIGKLEKALDGKQASGSYAAASHTHPASDIVTMTGYSKPSSTSAIGTSDTLNAAIGKMEKALDGKQATLSDLTADELATGTATQSRTVTAKVIADYVADEIGDINTGVMSVVTGASNGSVAVDGTDVYVKGLGTAAYTNSTAYAAASHGNHVPTTQTASNKVFLRNDNTWQTVTPANIGAAAASHNQASSTINAMTGYSKPTSTSAIGTSDTLNAAIGKLEKALDDKAPSTIDTGVMSVTEGATNGTISVDGTDVPVHGLASGAYADAYVHPTTAGNKHIPSGGSSGQILKWSAAGTATWAAEYSYTHPTSAGNKHIPTGGATGNVLKYGGSSGTASWGTLTASDVGALASNGTAVRATADASGNTITTTYATKDEVSAIPKFAISVVDSLPDTGAASTIYLVTTGTETDNLYTEYIYVDDAWEKLGTQRVDLSGYALKSDITTGSANGTIAVAGTNVAVKGLASGAYATAYSHPTTAGNKHIPSGGSSGQVLKYGGSSGTATWANEYSYTHPASGATAGDYGPSADVTGTNNTTISVPAITVDANGHVTSISNKTYTSKDTVYTHPTSAGNKHIPTGGSSGQVLKYSASGTAAWATLTAADVGAAPSTIDTGVMSVATGSTNGTLSVDGTDVAVKGLASGAYAAAYSHPNSGVTADTYGPTANVTGTNNTTLTVPEITVDAQGHITGVTERTYTSKDTTYSAMTASEATTGTATTARSITAKVLHDKIKAVADASAAAIDTGVMSVATGSTNGTLSVDGTDVAVKGLGSAAYTNSTAYAAASHGNHVPTTQTASNKVFLRNDNTWQTVTPANIGAAAASHTHNYAGSSSAGGVATSAAKLSTASAIDGVNFDGTAAITHFGTCSTAAATAAKTVACTSFTLVTGSRIVVKFTVTNTAASPTLNVNSTGAKAIQYRGSAISAGYLAANRTYEFIYDGTNYQLVGDLDTNTTYSANNGVSLSGTTFSNSGVRSIETGSTNGTISVNTGGTYAEVAVKGLASGAYAAAYSHPTSAGNKHIPTGGSTGQVLKYSGSSGTASWATLTASDVGALASNGTAVKATADASGNTITTTYATKTEMNAINKNTSRSVEYIIGTQTAATNAFTGVTEDSSLYDGKCINYYLPYAGTSSGDTLNLTLADGTTTGAKNIYLLGTTKLTTHFGAGQVFMMTYSATKGAWYCGNYDSNSNTYDRTLHNNNVKAATAVTAGTVIVGTSAGYKMAASGVTFDITYPILYASKAIAASGTNNATYDIMPGVNLATTKSGWTGTQYATVYLVGTLSGVTFTIDSAVFTTTAPSSADGKVYIPIGVMDTTTLVFFNPSKTIYHYTNGSFHELDMTTAATGGSNGTIKINGTDVAVKGLASGAYATAYSHPNSGATAGSYGPSADASPAHGAGFSVPYVTINAQGHVTAASTKTITLPAQYSHPNSGATAGSYGPSANASPAHGAGFSVPYVTINAQGHVTAASTKTITLPAQYVHPTGAGNNHIPAAGASGNFLKWSSAGTGKWESLTKSEVTTALGYTPPTTNTTYSAFTAATSSAAGATGLVPAPAKGKQDSFLRGNATWATASDIINTLSEGSSPAQPADFVVCQYAGGGTTTTTYHRRPVSKVLDALTKAQVTTALGYTPPTTNTTYAAGTGISLSGTTFSNSGVRSIETGSTNGTISVNTGGTSAEVAVKGLGTAAYTASTAYAAASHGNHVPTTQTASNKIFLRNDNTWQTVTPANIGAAASSHTHSYAGSASVGGPATTLAGTYSGSGGALAPSDVAGGNVKAAMMNNPKGLSKFPTYADSILMDTYTGSDVPWVTMFSIVKQDANPRAFISVGAKGNTTTWKYSAELLTENSTLDATKLSGTIPAGCYTNTTYSAGTGLSLSGTTINHASSITAGTAGTSSATSGSTLAVPYVTYNASGHITAAGTHTHTISGFLTSHQTIKQNGVTGATGNCYGACSTAAATAAKVVSITAGTPTLEAGLKVTVKFANANTAGTPTLNVNSLGAKNIFHKGAQITTGGNKALLAGVCDFVYDGTQFHLVGNYIDSNTTYSAGTGLSLTSTTFNHSNSVTAGTAGTSSATSGSTLAVPYVTYDAQGHITATGTHTHTVSGFLTAHQTIKQDAVTGATSNRFGTCATAAATAAKAVSITAGTPALEAGLKVTVKFTYANTANSPTLNVNSLGAKKIFHNGAQITSGANKALLAGACDFVYDGTQFHLVGNYIDTNTQTVTGVKGNSESSYRTGNVNITAANIGAAASNHNHSGVYTPYAASVGSNQKFIYTNSSGALTAANFEIWVTDT